MKVMFNGYLYEARTDFNSWFQGSKIVNDDGTPMVAYHQTSPESASSIRKSGFSFKNAPHKIIWFTMNKENIDNNTTGAGYSGEVLKMYVSMKNPAGWAEYEKYALGQLIQMGYDGVILDDDGFVFNKDQVRLIRKNSKIA